MPNLIDHPARHTCPQPLTAYARNGCCWRVLFVFSVRICCLLLWCVVVVVVVCLDQFACSSLLAVRFGVIEQMILFQILVVALLLCSLDVPIKPRAPLFTDQKWQDGEGVSAAAAEEPAVPGALHVPHPLQHIPALREEELLAALLHSVDGTGTGSPPHVCLTLKSAERIWIWQCRKKQQGIRLITRLCATTWRN